MWLVVGLGNPGPKYQLTRHNIGRILASAIQLPPSALEYQPRTSMNICGRAIVARLAKEGIPAGRLIVVHDDLETAFGRVRVAAGGSAKGHNGLKSIIAGLGSDAFSRVRVGIGRPNSRDPLEVAQFVLDNFN
jgi:PTH1 family peptidyl-tRNA hydrolase